MRVGGLHARSRPRIGFLSLLVFLASLVFLPSWLAAGRSPLLSWLSRAALRVLSLFTDCAAGLAQLPRWASRPLRPTRTPTPTRSFEPCPRTIARPPRRARRGLGRRPGSAGRRRTKAGRRAWSGARGAGAALSRRCAVCRAAGWTWAAASARCDLSRVGSAGGAPKSESWVASGGGWLDRERRTGPNRPGPGPSSALAFAAEPWRHCLLFGSLFGSLFNIHQPPCPPAAEPRAGSISRPAFRK
jgi:hypothetical protein